MAGVYVHIPFCKKRCLYCDFFSTTLLGRRKEYIEALLKEIEQRRNETTDVIKTIYLGGGTPSTLEAGDIRRILGTIGISDVEEITMELNPGDANSSYLHEMRAAGINRLSIGIQSFQDELLQLIGRRHNATQAREAIHMAQEAGFENISIDLMYALPTQTMEQWQANVEQALHFGVQHISTYGLIYEEGTVLTDRVVSRELEAIDEEDENAMYDDLCERLKQAGYIHYEVSNFALPGRESKHNSSYWDGTPYIGIGAGAHSYIGNIRSWNPTDLDAYISGIQSGTLQRESETLTDTDIYNERIMLELRTNRGINGALSGLSRGIVEAYMRDGFLIQHEGRIVATQKGLHILNRIIEDLMI